MEVSLPDLKENYRKMDVEFDLWMGESDVNDLIPEMVEDMKAKGFAHISNGALVVDVKEETDKKELPPCMILKSDGAANYETTDLATLLWRERELKPDKVLYVVDKRQELHFDQVFRCARKCGVVRDELGMEFIGFGSLNSPSAATIFVNLSSPNFSFTCKSSSLIISNTSLSLDKISLR